MSTFTSKSGAAIDGIIEHLSFGHIRLHVGCVMAGPIKTGDIFEGVGELPFRILRQTDSRPGHPTINEGLGTYWIEFVPQTPSSASSSARQPA